MRRVHSFGAALISGALVLAGCASSLFLVAAAAQAEQQAPPTVVEAAHQARTDKKPAGQSAKVWTNENLPADDGAVSIVGQPPQYLFRSPTRLRTRLQTRRGTSLTQPRRETKPPPMLPRRVWVPTTLRRSSLRSRSLWIRRSRTWIVLERNSIWRNATTRSSSSNS